MIQGSARSTAHRLRVATKPFIQGMRWRISRVACVLALAPRTRRRAWPPSAKTVCTKGKRARDRFGTPLAAPAIQNVDGVNLDREHVAVGVSQDAPLATVDRLARVVTLTPPFDPLS
jgi:hypothetical protein